MISRRPYIIAAALLFAVVAYGVLIAPDLERALLWSLDTVLIQGRRFGGVGIDWLMWGLLALFLVYETKRLAERADESLWVWLVRILAGIGAVQAGAGVFEQIVAWDVRPDARAFGFSTNPGFLAIWCAGGLFASLILAKRQAGFWPTAFLLLNALGLFMSGTRAAWLGVAIAVLPLLNWRGRALAGFLAMLLIGGSAGIRGQSIVEVFALGERLNAWRVALAGLLRQPWGHGWYSFINERVYDTDGTLYDLPHSLPLQLAYDVGLLGLAAVVAAALMLWRLPGLWRSAALAWGVYSLFWIPSPGWWFVGMLLIARAIGKPTEFEPLPSPLPKTLRPRGTPQYRTRHKRG